MYPRAFNSMFARPEPKRNAECGMRKTEGGRRRSGRGRKPSWTPHSLIGRFVFVTGPEMERTWLYPAISVELEMPKINRGFLFCGWNIPRHLCVVKLSGTVHSQHSEVHRDEQNKLKDYRHLDYQSPASHSILRNPAPRSGVGLVLFLFSAFFQSER